MGFDLNKINKLKQKQIDDKKQAAKDSKKQYKEAVKNYKAYEARLNSKVLNAWEDFLEGTTEWQDDVQKQVESYLEDPCDFNKFRLIMTVTHTKVTVIDDVIEDGHDDIIIDHNEYRIDSINIRGRACEALDLNIDINEKDIYFKVDTYLHLMTECTDTFIKVLRRNGIKAKAGPACKESTKYDNTMSSTTYKEPIEVFITF